MPLFPVRHDPLPDERSDDWVPWERFAGRHEGYHYCDVGRLPPKPGQPVVRRCTCGDLFRWNETHWCPMSLREQYGARLSDADDWFSEEKSRNWRLPRFRLRRLLLRLRGWDA